ncbi:MAG: ATP-binding protein [Pseudomonadota bacterium]|nr:ATP-binding protein [Pseudomonadota bacterium]
MLNQTHTESPGGRPPDLDDLDALRRKLAARDKTIHVLKRRVKERDDSLATPMTTLEQNIALGKVVAMKTQQLSDERRELQEALAELGRTQAMLLQAQKMESIGQLAAGVAHEINTPTQYVRDNVEFVSKAQGMIASLVESACALAEAAESHDPTQEAAQAFRRQLKRSKFAFLQEQVPAALEQSLDGLRRISRIVGAMKEFSHPSAGEKEQVDLHALAETTVTVARNEWKYVASLTIRCEGEVPPVCCLRDEIAQMLLNLVVNAAHAIKDTLEPGVRESGRIEIVLAPHEDSHVDIRVIDDGGGIPEAVREKVFDPFFTTKGVGDGTGQGLAIVYSTVVDKHGGVVFFDTEVGQGTEFVVRLPIHGGQEA